MEIRPIGIVHSPVANPEDMPYEGVPAHIELFPEYEKGLVGIERTSHLVVLGWFHHANRDSVQATKTRWGSEQEALGVFGLRAAQRPNPVGLLVCRLVRVDGLNLYLERLDFVDGTPIVDIKTYSPSWDCVFSARSAKDLRFVERGDERGVLDGMMTEAYNFHGERCIGIALGARLLYHAVSEWQIGQKDPKLVVHMAQDGCIADALQALTGATLGNGRMKVPAGRAFRLAYGGEKILAYQPKELRAGLQVEDVLKADINELFNIRSEVYAEGSGPHGGRPPKRAPAKEKQAALLERVERSLVEGRLPCAAAHRIAEELKVGVPDVGWAADELKARITGCQLGCFK